MKVSLKILNLGIVVKTFTPGLIEVSFNTTDFDCLVQLSSHIEGIIIIHVHIYIYHIYLKFYNFSISFSQ